MQFQLNLTIDMLIDSVSSLISLVNPNPHPSTAALRAQIFASLHIRTIKPFQR